MFITWIVVLAIEVYTYVQTHQIVYIKYIQVLGLFFFFVYLNKAEGKNFKRKKDVQSWSLDSNTVLKFISFDKDQLLNISVPQCPNLEIIIAFTLQGYVFSVRIKRVNPDKVHKIVLSYRKHSIKVNHYSTFSSWFVNIIWQ